MRIYTADNNKIIFDKILEEVANESIDNSRNFILLVPEKLSLTMEREILIKHKKKGTYKCSNFNSFKNASKDA